MSTLERAIMIAVEAHARKRLGINEAAAPAPVMIIPGADESSIHLKRSEARCERFHLRFA